MELNIPKIQRELHRLGKNKSWLAKQAGVSRPLVYYWFKTRTIRAASRISRALQIDAKDLIVITEEDRYEPNCIDQEVYD